MIRKLFGFSKKKHLHSGIQTKNSVDKDCNYCPKCGDEYRADILQCASCHIDLLSGSEKILRDQQEERQKSSRSMNISETDDLITVFGGKLNDVKAVKNLLTKETIPSLMIGEGQSKG